jgi:hypothetical protein
MSNKKGMLFGKINIIDLVIIVVVVCAGIFVVTKLLGVGAAKENTTKVKITYIEDECAEYVVPYTQVGDPLLDGTENVSLGTVTDVVTDTANSYSTLEDGTIVSGAKEGYVAVYITGELEGVLTDNGVLVGNNLYAVGHSMVLYAGQGKYYCVVYSIEPVE